MSRSADAERPDPSEFRTFVSEVVAVASITPSIRQLTFRGGLDDYRPVGGDEFLYLLLPPVGRTELTVGTDFDWQTVGELPMSEQPVGAYYSVRRWHPHDRALDLWFVLHDGGDASRWARGAKPGDPAALWGPRRCFHPPPGTSSYLFVIDETGFGATSHVLDQLLATDPNIDAHVVAEFDSTAAATPSHDHRVHFPGGPNVRTSWVDRRGQPPGSTSELVDAVRGLAIDPGVYAYGAAESRRITAVRQHLRHDRGLPRTQVDMVGYWRTAPRSGRGESRSTRRR